MHRAAQLLHIDRSSPSTVSRHPVAWVDFFTGPRFTGDRRRVFLPNRIEASLLNGPTISARIACGGAALEVTHQDGRVTQLDADASAIDLRDVAHVEVVMRPAARQAYRAATTAGPLRKAA